MGFNQIWPKFQRAQKILLRGLWIVEESSDIAKFIKRIGVIRIDLQFRFELGSSFCEPLTEWARTLVKKSGSSKEYSDARHS